MAFDPVLAAIRFGTGLSPDQDPVQSVRGVMGSVDGAIEARYPMPTWDVLQPVLQAYTTARKEKLKLRRAGQTGQAFKDAQQAEKEQTRVLRQVRNQTLQNTVARGAFDRTGFSTRLTLFWLDHFTAHGKGRLWNEMAGDYMDSAIRPFVLGRFEDMLYAAVTHPLMLHYLDQSRSVGPNSAFGLQRPGRGLNENLAREVMELHTLGVDGPYSQDDVRNLAKLLTGLTAGTVTGFRWRQRMAEPGPHRVMAHDYGRKNPGLKHVVAVLQDLARHPSTGRHLALKMARHFVMDDPSDNLVSAMAEAFGTNGDLAAMTEAMLRHPDAWGADGGNVKWAMEYMISVVRAMGVPPHRIDGWNQKTLNQIVRQPLQAMGQPFFGAPGPDGFKERDAAVMQPHTLAARLEWALRAPDAMVRGLPDPRKILPQALGPRAPQSLRFAVEASENRHEGLAMIFVSPAFQRR